MRHVCLHRVPPLLYTNRQQERSKNPYIGKYTVHMPKIQGEFVAARWTLCLLSNRAIVYEVSERSIVICLYKLMSGLTLFDRSVFW